MNEQDVKNLIQQELQTYSQQNQYKVNLAPIHTHSSTDSAGRQIPLSSISESITLNAKQGGILSPKILQGDLVNNNQLTNNNPKLKNPQTVNALPVNIIYDLGSTQGQFHGGYAPQGTTIFFDNSACDNPLEPSQLWVQTLNGWFNIGAGVTPTMKYKNGVTSRAGNATGGTQVIAHGLGQVPLNTRITINQLWANSTDSTSVSEGVYNGATASCTYLSRSGSGSNTASSTNTYVAVLYNSAVGSPLQEATIAVDATNITLTWTRTGTGTDASNMQIMWEAEALST